MADFDVLIRGGTVVDGTRFEGQRCTGATPGRLLRHGGA